MNFLDNLRKSWSDGNFILLYDSDDREGEVDMVIPSIMVKERHVALMRNDAGGLICTALSDELCENVGLPYMTDIYEKLKDENLLKMLGHGLPYGARSSFSIAINHKDSFTGITDVDRAMTINELGNIAEIFKDNEIKAVFICSDTASHVKYLELSHKFNKHAYCEKPIHLDINVVNRCLTKIKNHKNRIQLGFHRRYDISHQKIIINL